MHTVHIKHHTVFTDMKFFVCLHVLAPLVNAMQPDKPSFLVFAGTLTVSPLRPTVLMQVTKNVYQVSACKPLISNNEAVVSAINLGELYLTTYLTVVDVQPYKFSVTERAVLLLMDAVGRGSGAMHAFMKK